jgi:hypothetical protein
MTKCQALFALCISLLISGCSRGQWTEASCNLEPKDLPRLLQAIRPLIEKGYGDAEVETLQRLAETTPVKETRTKILPITFQGKDTRLRVELKKDDVDEIEIWFFTQPELAKEILKRMKEVLPH